MVRSIATISASGQLVRPGKMPELLARRIAEDILAQQLDSPALLPPERELKDAYGVSRGTLREAVRILESYGVITVKPGPNGGLLARPFRPDSMVRPLSFSLKLAGTSLLEVVEARLGLEPLIAEETAARATRDDTQELDAIVDQIDRELEDENSSLLHGREFHEALGRMSRNSVLACFAATLSSISDGHSAGVEYSFAQLRAINASHRRLVKAIKDKDGSAAADEARRHIQEFRTHLERHFPNLLEGPVRWMLTSAEADVP